MCGAYPFPGDLRAKFAWKEANRLSRGELIDNTAVTCSSLDRRPAALPLFLLSLSLSLPVSHPPSTPPCPLTPRNSLYLSRSARNTAQFDPTIPDLPRTSRYDVPDVRNSFHGAILATREAHVLLRVKRVPLENESNLADKSQRFAKNISGNLVVAQSCNKVERIKIRKHKRD